MLLTCASLLKQKTMTRARGFRVASGALEETVYINKIRYHTIATPQKPTPCRTSCSWAVVTDFAHVLISSLRVRHEAPSPCHLSNKGIPLVVLLSMTAMPVSRLTHVELGGGSGEGTGGGGGDVAGLLGDSGDTLRQGRLPAVTAVQLQHRRGWVLLARAHAWSEADALLDRHTTSHPPSRTCCLCSA